MCGCMCEQGSEWGRNDSEARESEVLGMEVFGRGEVVRDCGCDVLWVCGEWPGGWHGGGSDGSLCVYCVRGSRIARWVRV